MNKRSEILPKGIQIRKNTNFHEESNVTVIILLAIVALAVILTSVYCSIKF